MKKFLFVLILLLFSCNQIKAEEIKIVHFSDLHIDTKASDKSVRKFGKSLFMFEKAIGKTNLLYPDVVIFSGDMINKPIESELDIFLNMAKKIKAPFYFALGNHDVGVGGGLSKGKIIDKINSNCNWLKIEKPYYYMMKGDYIFIFMDGTSDRIITANGIFSEDNLEFLDTILQNNASKKAIIIQHFPLMPPYKSLSHEVLNKDKYFSILDKYDNVVMVLAGHYHASKAILRNNVLHITTPSMIEYPHAFRYLKINTEGDKITIESKIYTDEEQNDLEDIDETKMRLKTGAASDNFFHVTIQKPFLLQQESLEKDKKSFINFFKKIIMKIKLLCCKTFLQC